MRYYFRNLCFKMRAGNGRLWQGILPNSTRGYDGYFAGTDPAASTQATEFTDVTAEYMKCYLMRQGWNSTVLNDSSARVSKKRRLKTLKRRDGAAKGIKSFQRSNVKQEQHDALLDKSFINRRLGITTWEINAEVKEAADMAAMGTNMSEFQPGLFGAFEFNEDQSAKRTRTSKT